MSQKNVYDVSKNIPWYDDRREIERCVLDLEKFNELCKERSAAHYVRGERMHEWVIKGLFILDCFGNVGRAVEFIPGRAISDLPDVMTAGELQAFLNGRYPNDTVPRMGWGHGGTSYPSANISCPVCDKVWTVDNMFDLRQIHKHEKVSLDDFVGLTLGEVKRRFSKRTDALWRLQSEVSIRHDRFIDLSLKYPDSDDDWKKNIKVNETGWVGEREGIDDGYIIQPGDEALFNVWHQFHRACYRQSLLLNTRGEFIDVFHRANFPADDFEEIENEYGSASYNGPWFNVRTKFGTIRIGWRKRVINIDYSDFKDVPVDFSKFKGTQGSFYIHAWGYDEAVDILTTLREAIEAQIIQ